MPKGNVSVTAQVTPLVAVTGSQPPYIYDLPLLLSLPDGFEFRFRYHQIWVSNDVLGEMQSTPDQLLHRPLMVVFHSQEQKRLVPLRSCEVIGIDKLGPLVFLRFTVGPFVHVPQSVVRAKLDSDERKVESDSLSNIGRRLLGLEAYDLASPLPVGRYLTRAAADIKDIRWAKVDGSDAQSVSSAWAALAALLMNEDRLFQIPMFHLLGFQE